MGVLNRIVGAIGPGGRRRPPPRTVPEPPPAASEPAPPPQRRLPEWFDPAFYLAAYQDVSALNLDPVHHYKAHGHQEGRAPNAVLARIEAKVRPPFSPSGDEIAHQMSVIVDSKIFDTEWYTERFRIPAGESIRHYVTLGAFIGCDANPFFSSLDYFEANRDAAADGIIPVVHYIERGYAAGRKIGRGSFDGRLTAQVWHKGY